MKHRSPGSGGTPLTVTAMLSWPAPNADSNAGQRSRDVPIDPREVQAFTIEGDIWRMTVEDDDCDLHFEIAAPGSAADAPRVIAEVPDGPGYELVRADLLRAVHLTSARAGDRLAFMAPVRVRLTGYAFWDAAHQCQRDAVRGCSHGTATVATLWELHPVWRVEVLPQSLVPSPSSSATPPSGGPDSPSPRASGVA